MKNATVSRNLPFVKQSILFFFWNEIPIVDKILDTANNDGDLPNFSHSTLRRFLKVIYLKFVKRNR
jgi:hypothetical protein